MPLSEFLLSFMMSVTIKFSRTIDVRISFDFQCCGCDFRNYYWACGI